MPTTVSAFFDDLERHVRRQRPEAALRGLKALSSGAEDRDALRRIRHASIELLARLADLREDRTGGLISSLELTKAERDISDSALTVIGNARLLIDTVAFPDSSVTNAYASLEAYTRRAAEGARHVQRGVFISYRRTDTIDIAGRLYDRLRAALGDDQVFMDVESMPPGINFRAHVVSQISGCRACLVLIGDEWLSCVHPSGGRRLDDADDPVRVEVETALRVQVPTIPLLVSGARMPAPEELPPSIAALQDISGLPIRPNPDFDYDVSRLLTSLQLYGVMINQKA